MAPLSGSQVFFVATSEAEWATRRKGMKKWMKEVKRSFSVESVTWAALAALRPAHGDVICLFATACVVESEDLAVVTQLVEGGAGLLLFCGELTKTAAAQWNQLLSRFGIRLELNAVMNVAPHPYAHHPRHVFLQEAVLAALPDTEPISGVLLPGVTALKVDRPAQTFLSSDQRCYPANAPLGSRFSLSTALTRCLGAAWDQGGRVVVLASEELAADKWFETVSNACLLKRLLEWLTSGGELRRDSQPTTRRVYTPKTCPDLQTLAEMPRYCAQLSDKPRLKFHSELFAFSLEHCSLVKELSRKLGLPMSRLSVIAPQFLTPTPLLRPATFPVAGPRLPPPSLELFDLDTELQDKRRRLDAAFQNSDGLVGFLEQAGQICGVRGHRPVETLFNVVQQLAQYKQ